MKRLLICAGVFIGLMNMADAQKQTKAPTNTKNAATQKNVQRLESTNTSEAKAPTIPNSSLGWKNTPAVNGSYQINDPVVRTLNARANGYFSTLNYKDYMGVGRGTYGVANGHILLRSTGSTTSGGITGSGSVGSGSSTGSAGIHGTVVNTVNGKNPYAGPGMWGTTGTGISTNYRMTENSSQSIRKKKKD